MALTGLIEYKDSFSFESIGDFDNVNLTQYKYTYNLIKRKNM